MLVHPDDMTESVRKSDSEVIEHGQCLPFPEQKSDCTLWRLIFVFQPKAQPIAMCHSHS